MITFRDLVRALDEIDIQSHSRVILHARIEPFADLAGGVETLVGAVVNRCEMLVVPSFTPQTMVVPPIGPDDNALDYKQDPEANLDAQIFSPDLPVDPGLGEINEAESTHMRVRIRICPVASGRARLFVLEGACCPLCYLKSYGSDERR